VAVTPRHRVAAVSRAFATALVLAVGFGVLVRFAEPVLDGDLFFHLAYAEQMLERGTLVPDATLYSWTPASGAMIYCAWLGELVLAAGYAIGGLPALFLLRYLVLGAVALLLVSFARSSMQQGGTSTRAPSDLDAGGHLDPVPEFDATAAFTLLVVTAVLLGSYAGTLLKPELFSFLLLHLGLAAWSRAARAAGGPQEPREVGRLALVVPLLVLVWVNTHGAFALFAPFLALALAGAWLDRWLSPAFAFSRASLRRLTLAWVLAAGAVLCTPYGTEYPRQLLADFAFGATARPDEAWNLAHQPILAVPAVAATYLPFLLLLGVLLAGLLVLLAGLGEPGARYPWALLLVNAAYVPLFFAYNRATYWWIGIAGWSVLQLLARLRPRLENELGAGIGARARRLVPGFATAVLAVLALGLTAREVTRAVRMPPDGSWVGFGIGAINPVAEAEFLARRAARPRTAAGEPPEGASSSTGDEAAPAPIRLYNSFDSGSYLLWRLYPDYRVMTDSRSFPYLSWFADQRAFTDGEIFADFLARYPADLALVDHRKGRALRHFLDARDWHPVFFGPTGAVFVRRSAATPEELAGAPAHGGLEDLRNGVTALRAADFALAVGRRELALQLLRTVRDRPLLSAQVDPHALARRLAAASG
jgi:hypothetical protein